MNSKKQQALDELTRALVKCQEAGLKVYAIPRLHPFEEAGAVIHGVRFDGERYVLKEDDTDGK